MLFWPPRVRWLQTALDATVDVIRLKLPGFDTPVFLYEQTRQPRPLRYSRK